MNRKLKKGWRFLKKGEVICKNDHRSYHYIGAGWAKHSGVYTGGTMEAAWVGEFIRRIAKKAGGKRK